MDLREWTVLYVKHKDILARRLVNYKEEADKLVFEFKDHQLHAYAMETLALPKEEPGRTLLVTLNTRTNQDVLVKKFREFSARERLTIVFVHPQKNEKWFIVPHTHAQIADPNINLGIRALAENVPLVG